MGLGKTVQTIAFLAWLNYQRNGKVISLCDDEKHSSISNADDSGLDDSEDDEDIPTLSSSQEERPHLIVVPASVLSNWMNEFKKFAPNMKGKCVYQFLPVVINIQFSLVNIIVSNEVSWQSKGERADSR